MADSGVPNAGLPDCMSVLVRNDPYTHGVPGRISCTRAMPDERLGTLLRDGACEAHRGHRAGHQEWGDDDRLPGLRVLE